MSEEDFEYQEKIRKLAVKIVKHYRGKGPENVKVKLENDTQITVEIRGILSNLSGILIKEGAADLVAEYWEVLKPYLEREFIDEVVGTVGCPFTYSWRICDLNLEDRSIFIQLNKSV